MVKKICKKLEQIFKKTNNAPIHKNYKTHGTNSKPLGSPPKNPRK